MKESVGVPRTHKGVPLGRDYRGEGGGGGGG